MTTVSVNAPLQLAGASHEPDLPDAFLHPDWYDDAACFGADSELFFPTVGGSRKQVAEAVAVCARCPVKDVCFEFAYDLELYGIWGGTTTAQRQELRRQQKAAVRAAHSPENDLSSVSIADGTTVSDAVPVCV